MKKIALMVLSLCLFLPILMKAQIGSDDYISTQYQAFERERGEKAYVIAQTIMDSIGVPAQFDANSDKEAIKSQLLKAILLYYNITGEFNKQEAFMGIAEPFYRETGNLMDLAGCYHTMGISYQRMAQYDDAIHYYQLCSDILDEIGDPVALTNKRYEINNMANIYSVMEECDLAEEMYLKCIELLGDPGTDPRNNTDLASYYMNLAEVQIIRLSRMGADDSGRDEIVQKTVDYAEQSVELSRRYNDYPDKMANRYVTVSKAHFEAGRQKEAYAEMDSAMVIVKELELNYLETGINVLQGDFAYRTKRFDDSEKAYLRAMELAEEYHLDELYLEALNGAYLTTKERHPDRALTYLEQSKALEDSIYSQERQEMILEYQVKYQTAEKEHEIELQQAKTAQERQRVIWLIVALLLLATLTGLLLYMAIKRRKQNEALRHRNLIKDHLFSVVSHDIKAPLEAQTRLLDTTCEQFHSMEEDDLLESLQALKTSAHNLGDKIRNVIYWVKEELRDTNPHPVKFSPYELAQSVVDDQAYLINAKSLTVVNRIPNDWKAFDDMEIARMVLQNLLSNAVKFSWNEGEIELDATDDGQRYWISVTDKGMGINKDKLNRLMKEIASSSTGTSGEMGTGIGLFVSRQLLEHIGSEIRIDSVEGQGTVVRFSVKKA